jgi:GNAT superfamily N-acetyltransferase
MLLEWVFEHPALWDEPKIRIIGEAAAGVFDARFRRCTPGQTLPGDWWHAMDKGTGKVLGYGWLDIVWGDAEVTFAVDPRAEKQGVGSYILSQMELEVRRRGVNYLYNTVRPTHPDADVVTAWLVKRGFKRSEDGSLRKSLPAQRRSG